MDQQEILIIIAGMAVVTYLPRLLPALTLARRDLPPALTRWLGYIPCAVLAAMLLPSLLFHEGRFSLGQENIFLWAALPTFLVAWRGKSLFGSVAVGMACVALARLVMGG